MANGEAPRVLFFSSALGSGHERAAQGLVKGLSALNPEARTRVIDAVSYVSPLLERAVEGTYIGALRIAPDIWGHLYEKMRRQETTAVKPLFAKAVEGKFGPLVDEWQPDLIVCTHPFCCSIGGALKKTRPRLTLVATVTDFDMHAQWANEEVDLFIVGGENVGDLLRQRGISEDRILATGMPIDPAFAEATDLEATKRRYGIDIGHGPAEGPGGTERPIVLVMGGGLGMGPMEEVVRGLGQAATPLRVIAVTGKNTRLYAELQRERARFANPVTVLGYVDDVHALMRLARILVSKPGGMTVAEALASGLPIVVTGSLPGQETANTDFVRREKVGVVAPEDAVTETVISLLADEPRRQAMAERARALGKPRGALDAADAILRLWKNRSKAGNNAPLAKTKDGGVRQPDAVTKQPGT